MVQPRGRLAHYGALQQLTAHSRGFVARDPCFGSVRRQQQVRAQRAGVMSMTSQSAQRERSAGSPARPMRLEPQ